MAALITTDDVQPWLSTYRLELDAVDDLVEEPTISQEVTSRISALGHDVTTWIDSGTTPRTIRNIIALRVAAFRILKIYDDQGDESAYAQRLLGWAESMFTSVMDGTLSLVDDPISSDVTKGVVFFPTDSDTDDAPKFTMSSEF